MKVWKHSDRAPLRGHPAVGTIYADGGYEFDLAIVPGLPDIHGYVCKHGIACPGMDVCTQYCAECATDKE